MANCTINDRLFAVKPLLFCPSKPPTPEDALVQELVALQTLSRLGLAILSLDDATLLPAGEWSSPGYWHTLNQCVELALTAFEQCEEDTRPFSILRRQIGQVQAVLVKGLEQLYEQLSHPEAQLWYNYLSVMLDRGQVLLEQKGLCAP